MAVQVRLPGALRPLAGDRDTVPLDDAPKTVGQALERLFRLYPHMRLRVLTEQGEVRPHVNLFVGAESIRYTGGLATRVREGDEISIIPAVSGGVATNADHRVGS